VERKERWRHPRKRNMECGEKNEEKESSRNRWNFDGSVDVYAGVYAGKDLRGNLINLLKQIWKDNEIPEDWRKSIVVPLYKRGEVRMYLAITEESLSLLCTTYKILAEVIRRRLEEKTERRMLLPETQAGFRKRRSTLDNIYVLSHVTQRGRNLEGKERKVYVFFADLRAAFDNVDKSILWKTLKEKEIEEGLLRRIERIYERTETTVRTKLGKFQDGKRSKVEMRSESTVI